jgi:REP element-mobilizing transposase RayT
MAMATISRDTPGLYITAVCKDRLPVFRKDEIKELACKALNEARTSGKFLIFAYVIMLDHIHIITDGARKASDTLRFIKGIMSHRIIEYLKEQGYQRSLEKLKHEEKDRQYKYSLWEQESNVLLLTSESFFMQKVNYINLNPVRAEMVERAIDSRWSSARFWARCPKEDEPLIVDIEKIVWRKPK